MPRRDAYPKKWPMIPTGRPGEFDQPMTTIEWNGRTRRVEEKLKVLDLEMLGLFPYGPGYRLPDELLRPHTFLHVTRWPTGESSDLYYLLGVGSYDPTDVTPEVVANRHFKYDPRNNSPVSKEPWLKKGLGGSGDEPSRFVRIQRYDDGGAPRRVPTKHEFIHLNHYGRDRATGEHYYYTLGAVNFVLPMRTAS